MPDLFAHVRKSARNNAWSNRRLYAACAAVGPGALTAPRICFFPSISATLNHILAFDREARAQDLADGGLEGPETLA